MICENASKCKASCEHKIEHKQSKHCDKECVESCDGGYTGSKCIKINSTNKCVITDILEVASLRDITTFWKVKFSYSRNGKILEKTLFFDYIEEVKLCKVGFEFEE
jgi:hypothetical protein